MLFALLATSIYAYVGWRLSRRIVASSEGRIAWQSFTVWWYGLAVTTLIGCLLNLFGALGLIILPLFVTATYINLLVICLALWGLLYYLIYLFTGNSRLLMPLTIFYMIYYVLLVYYITASVPESINVDRWRTTLAYRTPLTGPFFVFVIVLLLLPQIMGGFAYFTLYFRVTDVTQKYRVLLVSWSIIIWFLSAFLAGISGFSQYDWWQVMSRLIGLGAATAILLAYQPPSWVKQRFGVTSLADESS